jgi:hypothetical protein
MSDSSLQDTPKVVSDINLQIVRILKSVSDQEFITVLSHPATLARLDPQQQQQQQQQVVRRATAE